MAATLCLAADVYLDSWDTLARLWPGKKEWGALVDLKKDEKNIL